MIKFTVCKADLPCIDFENGKLKTDKEFDIISVRQELFKIHPRPLKLLKKSFRIEARKLSISAEHGCGLRFKLKGKWENGNQVEFESSWDSNDCACTLDSMNSFFGRSKTVKVEIVEKYPSTGVVGEAFDGQISTGIGKSYCPAVAEGSRSEIGSIMAVQAYKVQKRAIKALHLPLSLSAESADASLVAYGCTRRHFEDNGMNMSLFDDFEIAIDFNPSNFDIPLEGDSLGVAVAVAITSLALSQAPRYAAAFTGRIFVDGTIGAIGGVPAKMKAAKKNKIKLFLPIANQFDAVINVADVSLVQTFQEVISEVFVL